MSQLKENVADSVTDFVGVIANWSKRNAVFRLLFARSQFSKIIKTSLRKELRRIENVMGDHYLKYPNRNQNEKNNFMIAGGEIGSLRRQYSHNEKQIFQIWLSKLNLTIDFTENRSIVENGKFTTTRPLN